jgi:hypothetical protein
MLAEEEVRSMMTRVAVLLACWSAVAISILLSPLAAHDPPAGRSSLPSEFRWQTGPALVAAKLVDGDER